MAAATIEALREDRQFIGALAREAIVRRVGPLLLRVAGEVEVSFEVMLIWYPTPRSPARIRLLSCFRRVGANHCNIFY